MPGDPHEIHVDVPADPSSGRILRSVGRSAGSNANFGYDRVEDLSLAIDEAFAALLEQDPVSVSCSLSHDDAAVRVSLTANEPRADGAASTWEGSLHRVVLESVATDVTLDGHSLRFGVTAAAPG